MSLSLQKHIAHLLKELGDNPKRAGLLHTPKRVAKTLQFLTQGYHQSLDAITKDALFPATTKEMVMLTDITFYSLCEHHLLPFFGKCHIAYLPHQSLLGLSRIVRLVEHYARRLQVQENLTQEIAKALQKVTQAKGVGVIMQAQHCCMMMHPLNQSHATLTTSATLGLLKRETIHRKRFFSHIIGNIG